jgi:uncharacterized membrane protein YqaE (UPF0057 family)
MRSALVVLACILPPLALLLARMPGQALLNLGICAATIFSLGVPLLTVALSLAATVHAVWLLHRQRAAQAT